MTEVFTLVLSLSLSGTLVALMVVALRGLFGSKLSNAWRYYVWLIVLLRLVVPFAPSQYNLFDRVLQQVEAARTPQPQILQDAPAAADPASVEDGFASVEAEARLSGFSAPMQDVVSPPQVQGPGPSGTMEAFLRALGELWQVAWVVWLGVALMLLVRGITSYRSFIRFIRAGWSPVDDPRVLDTLDEVSKLYGIRRILPLYLNPLATSPMLVGILRPVIVLPTVRLEKENLRHVLAHELVHYKRKDIVYKWFVQVVACLHWYNPVIYFVKKDIDIACELSCDEKVLSRMERVSHRQYGDTLLAVIQTSGQYGDTVASVTMSEEGKMMKKRLHSITHPRKQSRWTVAFSVLLSLLLLFAATCAGAYTGNAGEDEVAPEAAQVSATMPAPTMPSPEPTKAPTPGEKLDAFLGDLDEVTDAFTEHAQEWGEIVAEKSSKWAENWDWTWDWPDSWALPQWDWEEAMDSEEHMFGSYHIGTRIVLNEGFYKDGYVLHLKYDSHTESAGESLAVLESPKVIIPEDAQQLAEDPAFLDLLQDGVNHLIQRYGEDGIKDGFVKLVRVYGPYEESPDALLARFYEEDAMGLFVAVLNSGLTSIEQRMALLQDAATKEELGYFSLLLDAGTPVEKADELLQAAYDNRDVGTFYILLEYAGTEAKQRIKDQAVSDGEMNFLVGIDEAPSTASIDAMLEEMGDNLDTSLIAMVSEYLTEEQALRIATTAYAQDDVGAFTLVLDQLDDEEVEAFNERARQDKKTAFYAITGW